jgi:phosphate-selective porin OprO/OprP
VLAQTGAAADSATIGAESAAAPVSEPQPATKKETKKKRNARFTFSNHPSFRIGSVLRVDFEARLETDQRLATSAIGLDSSQFNFGSLRAGVSGTLFDKLIGFEVSRDPDPSEGDAEWKDVYVNVRPVRALEVQAGRFKMPFGREMLTGRSNLDFVYRSFAASTLSPSRDVGVMAHGQLRGGILEYATGYFARDGDNARTKQTRGARDTIAARLVLAPFASQPKNPLASLHLGAAATTSRLDNQLGLRGATVFEDGEFFDRVYVNGRRLRTGVDVFWRGGPASVSGEMVTVSDERKGMGLEQDDLDSVRATAWYVAGTWALTGEEKRGRLEPKRRFLQGGIGALELAARLEQFRFLDVSYPVSLQRSGALARSGNADLATTLGVNWYLNRFVKVQPNLVIETIRDPQRSPAPGTGGRFISGVIRCQFTL